MPDHPLYAWRTYRQRMGKVRSDQPERLQRSSDPAFRGVHRTSGRLAGGWIYRNMDYFALYNQALTLESAAQIHAMEPYVFDSGISLLYLFHGEPRRNFLGSGTLLLQEGAQLKIAEGTIYEEAIEPIRFRSCSTFSVGAFAQWEADILAISWKIS
jgi:hypothetical protein